MQMDKLVPEQSSCSGNIPVTGHNLASGFLLVTTHSSKARGSDATVPEVEDVLNPA